MEPIATIALASGAAWASGLNVYAVIVILGALGTTGHITLPADLEILMNPLVIAAAGFMYCVEFFADKTPGVDTGWDAVHTFIRVPAGALLAAGALGDMEPALQMGAFLVGGGLAATSHTTKAATRVMLNTSPEPFSNWTASIAEDVAVVAGLWAALNHPVFFLIALTLVVLLMWWILPKLWRGVKHVWRAIMRFFGKEDVNEAVDKMDLNDIDTKALGTGNSANSSDPKIT